MTAVLDEITAGPVLVGRFEHGSPQWLDARRGGLGGSEIAAVLGLSPWDSPLSLYHRKRGELPDLDLTDEMEAGTRCEPMIARWFADHHPEYVVEEHPGTWRHRDRDWEFANPDAALHPIQAPAARAGAEWKFSLFGDDFGPEGTDEIPVHYRCQVLHYIDVMGWPGMWLVVFIGARGEFREYWIPADEDEQLLLRASGEVFMGMLAAGERPPLDAHPVTQRTVRQLHPDIDGRAVEIPAELSADWHTAKRQLVAAENVERLANTRLLDVLGDARRGRVNGVNHVMRVPSQGAPPHLRSSLVKRKKVIGL